MSVDPELKDAVLRVADRLTVPTPPRLPPPPRSNPNDAKRYWDADAGAGGRSQADMARQLLADYAAKHGSLKGLKQADIEKAIAGAPDPIKAKQVGSRARELALSDPGNAGVGWQEGWKRTVTPDRLRTILDNAGTGGKTLAVPLSTGVVASTLPGSGAEAMPDPMRIPERPKGAASFSEGSARYHGKDGKFVGALPDHYRNGGAISSALGVARMYADGGAVHAGPVVGKSDGRADDVPISVDAGSYVIPADCVSALGDGNSTAGMEKLSKAFGKAVVKRSSGGSTPIAISHGEYVVDPTAVAKLGRGDVRRGHAVLDATVKSIRADYINRLGKTPPPSK